MNNLSFGKNSRRSTDSDDACHLVWLESPLWTIQASKEAASKLFLHITIVTKEHHIFSTLKKIFLISIHRLRSKGEKTNCGFTQLCKQTERALNNFLGMRNVVYCFTVFVMDVATFFDALFEYRPEENKAQWKYFPGKFRNWSKLVKKSGFL